MAGKQTPFINKGKPVLKVGAHSLADAKVRVLNSVGIHSIEQLALLDPTNAKLVIT
jgi:hypothetical protein